MLARDSVIYDTNIAFIMFLRLWVYLPGDRTLPRFANFNLWSELISGMSIFRFSAEFRFFFFNFPLF